MRDEITSNCRKLEVISFISDEEYIILLAKYIYLLQCYIKRREIIICPGNFSREIFRIELRRRNYIAYHYNNLTRP